MIANQSLVHHVFRNALLTGTLASSLQKNYYYPLRCHKKHFKLVLSLSGQLLTYILPVAKSQPIFKTSKHELTSTHDLMWWVYPGLQQPESHAKGNTKKRPLKVKMRLVPLRESVPRQHKTATQRQPFPTRELVSPLNSPESYRYCIYFIFLNVPPRSTKNLR